MWPVEYSHWINIKTILDELVSRGHEVTVMTSSASIFINTRKEFGIKFENFPVSLIKDDFEYIFKDLLDKWTYMEKDSFFFIFLSIAKFILEIF